MSNMFFYIVYTQSEEDKKTNDEVSRIGEDLKSAEFERDSCRGTLEKIGNETITMREKENFTGEELVSYYSDVFTMLKESGSIKEIAEFIPKISK